VRDSSGDSPSEGPTVSVVRFANDSAPTCWTTRDAAY
jgi:hypothetical protein